MDKDELNKIANEAVDLWLKEEYEKAEPLFRQTLPFVDDNHWRSVDYLANFASNQSSLGHIDEATSLYARSVDAALATEDEASIAVTVARLCFADHLFRHGQLDKALETIQPSLDIDCAQRKSLVVMYARIHNAKGNTEIAESAAHEYLSLAPDSKLKTVDDVLLRTGDDE